MAINEIFKKKQNEDGTDYIDPITNDFVNEVIYSEEVEEGVKIANWKAFKENLFNTPIFLKLISEANPNAYTTLIKIIQDGEDGKGKEDNFTFMFKLLNVNWNDSEIKLINEALNINGFSISV